MILPTLKLLVLNVGHVNNRGNIIYIGIGKFVQTFPSPICIFCISVAETCIVLQNDKLNVNILLSYHLWNILQHNHMSLLSPIAVQLILSQLRNVQLPPSI